MRILVNCNERIKGAANCLCNVVLYNVHLHLGTIHLNTFYIPTYLHTYSLIFLACKLMLSKLSTQLLSHLADHIKKMP